MKLLKRKTDRFKRNIAVPTKFVWEAALEKLPQLFKAYEVTHSSSFVICASNIIRRAGDSAIQYPWNDISSSSDSRLRPD